MTPNDVIEITENKVRLRDFYATQKKSLEAFIESYENDLKKLELARTALTEFARVSQEEIKQSIEDLVTLALRSVFDRDWEFKLHFERVRNQFEIRPVIVEDGEEFNPKDELGGGALDVISYALRVILFTLGSEEDTEKVMWLDEPMKFVGTGDLMNRAGAMIREIASELGIQTIMITHDQDLAEIADAAWSVEHVNGQSVVTQTKGKEVKKRRRIKANG